MRDSIFNKSNNFLEVFFLFFILLAPPAQSQNCRTPLADQLYQPKFEQVKAQPEDDLRFDIATLHLVNNCFSSLQIKYIARLFVQDEVRFTYAKLAYKHCTDVENYYDVLDAFKGHGYAFRMYDYLNAIKNFPPPSEALPPCNVSASDFTQIKSSIGNENVSSTQLALAKQVVTAKKCFSSPQIKELVSLISIESYKLEFAKYAYAYTTDKENYYQVADVFSTSSTKKQLLDFIGADK